MTREEVMAMPPGTRIRVHRMERHSDPIEGEYLGCGQKGITVTYGMGRLPLNWYEIRTVERIPPEDP